MPEFDTWTPCRTGEQPPHWFYGMQIVLKPTVAADLTRAKIAAKYGDDWRDEPTTRDLKLEASL